MAAVSKRLAIQVAKLDKVDVTAGKSPDPKVGPAIDRKRAVS